LLEQLEMQLGRADLARAVDTLDRLCKLVGERKPHGPD